MRDLPFSRLGGPDEWWRKYPTLALAEAAAKRLCRLHQQSIEIRLDDNDCPRERTFVATVLLDAVDRLWVQVEHNATHLL